MFNKNITSISGDIDTIIRYGRNELAFILLYRIDKGEKYYIRIEVLDNELKEILKTKINPLTGAKLTIQLRDNNFICADLISVDEYNLPLFYPQYICEKCGHNYLYNKVPHCDICGGVIKEFKNY